MSAISFKATRTTRRLAAIAAALALAACQSNQQAQPQSDRSIQTPQARSTPVAAPQTPVKPLEPVRTGPIQIALLAPLSGDFADAGRDLANGAAMALLETEGVEAEIIAYDTAGDAAKAVEAIAAAAEAKADIVVGPLFGRNAAAISGNLAEAKLTALAFSNDSRVIGPNVALMGRSVAVETARIVRHAAGSGARVVAVFGRQGPVGAAAASQAEQEAATQNGLIVRRALYAEDASYTDVARNVQALLNDRGRQANRAASAQQLEAQLKAAQDPGADLARVAASRQGQEKALFQGLAGFYAQMIGAGTSRDSAIAAVVGRYRAAGGLGGGAVDAVLLTVNGAELSTVAPMFQLYDAQAAGVRLLGLAGWAALDPSRARELYSGRFATEPYSERFDDRYEAAFGALPTELAGVAYDAVRLALAASRNSVRPIPAAALAKAGTVNGAQGQVRMSEAGMALRPLEVLEIQPDGFKPIEPARMVDPAAPATTPPTAGS